MKSIIQVLFGSIKAKGIAAYTKIKTFASPSYLKALFTGKLREFFGSLFDIKPKSKDDYYVVLRWLIGKKLAFAIIIALGALSLWYIVSLSPTALKVSGGAFGNGKETAYKYSSMALKKYTGQAKIVGEQKYIAYIGDITNGLAAGKGTLYNRSGQIVYEGEFANNMYNGKGKLYFSSGSPKYSGEFKNNLYSGKGTLFRENGLTLYEGEFESGLKNGTGTLYDKLGKPIWNGRFHRDNIVYSDFIGRTADTLGEAFLGTSSIYNYGESTCVSYDELFVILESKADPNSIEDKGAVKKVLVLGGFKAQDKELQHKAELDAYFGKPAYAGDTYINFAEAVTAAELIKNDPQAFSEPPQMEFDKPFSEVYDVKGYNTKMQIYIASYEKEGLLYSFYFENPKDKYKFYSIEQGDF